MARTARGGRNHAKAGPEFPESLSEEVGETGKKGERGRREADGFSSITKKAMLHTEAWHYSLKRKSRGSEGREKKKKKGGVPMASAGIKAWGERKKKGRGHDPMHSGGGKKGKERRKREYRPRGGGEKVSVA